MFRKFRIRNFMCLQDVSVDLEPLTIFIGPNSAGKSALFKALTTFSRLLWYPARGGYSGDFNVEPGITLDNVVWQGDTSFPIIFEVWLQGTEGNDPDYILELSRGMPGWSVTREEFRFHEDWLDTSRGFSFQTSRGEKHWPGPYKAVLAELISFALKDPIAGQHLKPIQELRYALGQARRYRPSASDIASSVLSRQEPRRGTMIKKELETDETGRGLGIALEGVFKGDPKTFTLILEKLQELHNHIESIDFVHDFRGTGLVFRTNRTRWNMPASLESDGVLLSTFLLWRIFTARQNLKLCLEETENGVPLSGLSQRYELIKQFTKESGDRPGIQILIATHSRDFLNAIRSRNDIMAQIRVVEFGADTGTQIHTLHHYREIEQLLEKCRDKMGDLWWSGRLEHKLRQ